MRQESELMDKALEILDYLELGEMRDQRAANLSGGQMKLLEIGRALISNPRMILLDEPVAGINPFLMSRIFDKILEIRKRLNLTFLIVEHRMEILLSYVDWLYVMYKGGVIVSGRPMDVVKDKVTIDIYIGRA